MPYRRLVIVVLALAARPAAAVDLSWSALAGYQDGMGLRLTGTAAHLVKDVPVGLAFGAGFASMDPGNAAAARRVFINDATDGTPQKSGYAWDLRLDAVWFFKVAHLTESGAFFGARRSVFAGRFRYIGGNEDFTVESTAWGVGLGFRGAIPLSTRWSLAFAAGLDWFPVLTLYGHDASYSSNGAIVNQRNNYTWADASSAINRPSLLPSLMVGASWR